MWHRYALRIANRGRAPSSPLGVLVMSRVWKIVLLVVAVLVLAVVGLRVIGGARTRLESRQRERARVAKTRMPARCR